MSETTTEPTTERRYYRHFGLVYRASESLVEFEAGKSTGNPVWIESVTFTGEAGLVDDGAAPIAAPDYGNSIDRRDAEIERLKKSNAELLAACNSLIESYVRPVRVPNAQQCGAYDRAREAIYAATA